MNESEIADLIVQGRNREAYEKMRDYNPGLGTWDNRERHLAGLAAQVEQVDHDELDRRHRKMHKKMFPPPKVAQYRGRHQ